MVEKLYYKDSHLFEFEALVTDCREDKKGFLITLDKTAFFPEGGGQAADTGTLGGVNVLDVREKDGEILHLCDAPLKAGDTVKGCLDAAQRLERMQSHSGEHVVSGIVHGLFGYDNVGFHMGSDFMTINFSGELSDDDLKKVETLANETVRKNIPIRAYFPGEEELKTLEYRSKLELTHDVRLVEIPGVDLCACCAPHVSFTGEIGLIKVLSSERHRGGQRITLVCGMAALEAVRVLQENASAVSVLLSAKRTELAPAVTRLIAERDELKEKLAQLSMDTAKLICKTSPAGEDSVCVFNSSLTEPALRELANLLSEKCALAACFSGDDEQGYKYIIKSSSIDMKKAAKVINEGIDGRGGGRDGMITGFARKPEAEIRIFMENLRF